MGDFYNYNFPNTNSLRNFLIFVCFPRHEKPYDYIYTFTKNLYELPQRFHKQTGNKIILIFQFMKMKMKMKIKNYKSNLIFDSISYVLPVCFLCFICLLVCLFSIINNILDSKRKKIVNLIQLLSGHFIFSVHSTYGTRSVVARDTIFSCIIVI